MELLLVKDVEGLGSRGEIVSVARGYARNYLLPKGLATVPDEEIVAEVRAEAARLEAELESIKQDRMEVAKELATVTLTFRMKAGKEGHLYGSVGPRQIADELAAKGFDVEEKHVRLEQPLKKVGEFDVPIALHPEVQVPVMVAVVAEED